LKRPERRVSVSNLLNRNVDQPFKYVATWLIDEWSKIGLHVTQRVVPTGPSRIVIKAGEALLSFKVDSWQNGVNRNVDGRTVRRVLGYNGNGAHFRRTTDEVAKGGYQEFAFR
jgi:hypothetical protein